MNEQEDRNYLHSLMPLEEFKAIMGIDDRDDCLDFASVRNPSLEFLQSKNSKLLSKPPSLAAFCIVTATLTIEHYCRRKLLEKKYFETINLYDELCLPLKEYPVNEILSVSSEQLAMSNGNLIEPEFYRIQPDIENFENIPQFLCLSPAVLRMGCKTVKVIYYAGYKAENIPADLSAACMELAAWNFNRYKSRRVGFNGNIRKDAEQIERTIPENVKALIEPYRRKTI